MIEVKQKGNGWLLGDRVFFGEEETAEVTLRLTRGSAMRYGKATTNIVEFPGEYDIGGVSVNCFESENKLSYVLVLKEERIAILANVAALEIATFDKIDTWLCVDESLKTEIAHLEMDGDIKVLGEKREEGETL